MAMDQQTMGALEQLALKIHDLEQRVAQMEQDKERMSDPGPDRDDHDHDRDRDDRDHDRGR